MALVKFVAIKECPNQLPGTVFEATEEAGGVLVSVGAARRAEDDEPPTLLHRSLRRRYQRRDVKAEP